MLSDTFTFHPALILRTPTLGFNQEISKEALKEYLLQPIFEEALYLASPTLYQESRKWLAGQLKSKAEVAKLVSSLAKYLNRSRSRCTPFGRFASSSVVQWQRSSAISLGNETRCARLDMSLLRALAQQLSAHPLIQRHLRYYPNSSWYTIGDEVRYIEYDSQAGRRTYQISSVRGSEELQQILAACESGCAYFAIIDYLVGQRIPASDAIQFADELIQAQLLVSELEPTITGNDPLQQIMGVLRRVDQALAEDTLKPLITQLAAVERELTHLDQSDLGINPYQAIEKQIRLLQIPWGSGSLFQVNTFRQGAAVATGVASRSDVTTVDRLEAQPNTLDQRWQGRIKQAVEVLVYLTSPSENQLPGRRVPAGHDHSGSLERFRRQFYERYEEAEMPLLSVLDTETGIKYGEIGQEVSSSLVDGLVSSSSGQLIHNEQKSTAEQWLLQKVQRGEGNSKEVIRINSKEVKFLASRDYAMPPSSSVVFRFVDRETMYLEGVRGTSAANLLGRFANDNDTIHQTVRDITEAEQKNNPDVILAEIVHLPGQRVGNILRRPVLRKYELPYLAQSTQPQNRQIAAQDLWVSVRNERVILRSRRLNKEIIPRLSTAHNYAHQSLPVYQFLCDLQSQGIHRSLNLNWHPGHYGLKQLPRLIYGRTILGLKTWYLQREDFQELLSKSTVSQSEQMAQWVAQWKLPRYFVLAEGDRELLVDTQNPLTVQVWRDTIRKQPAILLKEFLFDPKESMVTDEAGGPYVNQWIASVIKEGVTYQSSLPKPVPTVSIQRKFTLGSDWLYYKLYSGTRSSDKILLEVIHPLTETLLGNSLIDEWFFIRYADPDDHLRVRLHLTDPGQLGEVISLVNEYVKPFEESGHIWKSHTHTYRREVERYGAATMALSESFFFHDSQRVLSTLTHTQGDERRSQRWLMAIVTVDQWLTWFGYDTSGKHRWMQTIREKFYQEFAVDKVGKRKIDARYRAYQDRIATELQANHQEDKQLRQLITQIKQTHTSEVSLDQLVGSYIHMHINRLISADQRLHELIVYDFLARYYKSVLVRR